MTDDGAGNGVSAGIAGVGVSAGGAGPASISWWGKSCSVS